MNTTVTGGVAPPLNSSHWEVIPGEVMFSTTLLIGGTPKFDTVTDMMSWLQVPDSREITGAEDVTTQKKRLERFTLHPKNYKSY